MTLPAHRDPKLLLALLHEIDIVGGHARPSEVVPKMHGYFPEITEADLELQNAKTRQNKWENIVHFARLRLVEQGFLAREHGIWRLAAGGKRWLDAHWQGPDADYSSVEKLPRTPVTPLDQFASTDPVDQNATEPPKARRLTRSPLTRTAIDPATIDSTAPAPPVSTNQESWPLLLPVPDPVDQLVRRLTESQRRSGSPQQFEQDLTEAFAYLGFEAQHVGGSGETDIFITASLGQLSYSAVVDAKSTHTGRVLDSQINWPAIDTHRQGRGATFAVVVGEDFSGGQVQKFADQYKVTLITTSMLGQLLQLHSATPLSLRDLRDLFVASGRADASVQALLERGQEHSRHWQLIAQIIDTVGKFERQMPEGFAPKVDHMHLVLRTQILNAGQPYTMMPTLQEVENAMAFLSSRAVGILSSRAVGILGEVAGSNGAYQLVMSPMIARRRLQAMARIIDAPREAALPFGLQRVESPDQR